MPELKLNPKWKKAAYQEDFAQFPLGVNNDDINNIKHVDDIYRLGGQLYQIPYPFRCATKKMAQKFLTTKDLKYAVPTFIVKGADGSIKETF